MPNSDGLRGRPFREHRQVVEGIAFRCRTGVAWRDLTERFALWQTVWKRHHRLRSDATWERLLTVLAVVDGKGRSPVILLTPGQAGDAPMLLPLLAQLKVTRPLGRGRR